MVECPGETSHTSSKPPATERREQRDHSKPGGAKRGHQGHSRVVSDDLDTIVRHRSEACACCDASLHAAPTAEVVSVAEQIELPAAAPILTRHQRLAVRCPRCGERVVAPVPEALCGIPFGPRRHAVARYLETFQALSYERLQAALSDLFGLTLSQGGLMSLLRRAQGCFHLSRDAAVATLRRAEVVACDKTDVRIEGSNAYHWVLHLALAPVHRDAAVADRGDDPSPMSATWWPVSSQKGDDIKSERWPASPLEGGRLPSASAHGA
jgi:transposase